MKTWNRIGMCLVAFGVVTSMLCACGNTAKKEAIETIEEKYTKADWRGGLTRADKIRTDVIEVLNTFKAKNTKSLDGVVDFWTSDSYAYISKELLDFSNVENTWYLNELSSTWDEAMTATMESFNAANGQTATKTFQSLVRERDHMYTLNFSENMVIPWKIDQTSKNVNRVSHCIYDATHDWLQNVIETKDNLTVNDGIFEYGRNGNTFYIQTDKERLAVTYAKTKKSGDLVIGQKVKSFVYSRLDGNELSEYQGYTSYEQGIAESEGKLKQTFDPYNTQYQYLDKELNVTTQYTKHDSIFPVIEDLEPEWVISAGTYSDVIVYDGEELVIQHANTLSEKLETITFDKKGKAKVEETPLEMETIDAESVPVETE